MLEAVVGNRYVAQVLLFLFVNETGYVGLMQSLLGGSLSAWQKAIARLEGAGIVVSEYQGKRRVYCLNGEYPLFEQLEALLKKAYTLMPASEKKRCCFIHRPRLRVKDEKVWEQARAQELLSFWDRLTQVKTLRFSALFRQQGRRQVGQADVVIERPSPETLIFREKGCWITEEIAPSAFTSSFRFTLDLKAGWIELEHLRYGDAQPVLLFHLTAGRTGILESVDAHVCAQDTYLAHIIWSKEGIDMQCRVIGPMKNIQLTYQYK